MFILVPLLGLGAAVIGFVSAVDHLKPGADFALRQTEAVISGNVRSFGP